MLRFGSKAISDPSIVKPVVLNKSPECLILLSNLEVSPKYLMDVFELISEAQFENNYM